MDSTQHSSGGTAQDRLCAITVRKNIRGRSERSVKTEALNDFTTGELH